MRLTKIKTLSKIFSIQLKVGFIPFLFCITFHGCEVFAADSKENELRVPLLRSASPGALMPVYSSINADLGVAQPPVTSAAGLRTSDGHIAVVVEGTASEIPAAITPVDSGLAAIAEEFSLIPLDPRLITPVNTIPGREAVDKLQHFVYVHMGKTNAIQKKYPSVSPDTLQSHLLTRASQCVEDGDLNRFFKDLVGLTTDVQQAYRALHTGYTALREAHMRLKASRGTGRAATDENIRLNWQRSLQIDSSTALTIPDLERATTALMRENIDAASTNYWLKVGWGTTAIVTVGAIAGLVTVLVKYVFK